MACGLKQRRPTEAHCACVGGVVDVESCCQSLTVGCGNGSGADDRAPPAAANSSHAMAAATTNANGTTASVADFLICSPLLRTFRTPPGPVHSRAPPPRDGCASLTSSLRARA